MALKNVTRNTKKFMQADIREKVKTALPAIRGYWGTFFNERDMKGVAIGSRSGAYYPTI